jgi:hypothetical protein
MSTDYNLVALLTQVLTDLYQYVGLILISIGTVSSILSLIVFTKKNLRKSPCSIYFVAVNVGNLLLIYGSFLPTLLENGFNINPSIYNLPLCHFRFYLLLIFDMLSPTYLIFASIDRVLYTSRNAGTRRRSTRRLAYICIIGITLFWLIFHIHALFFTTIMELLPGYIICYFQNGIYLTLIGYYSIVFKGILVPLCMLILAFWTVKNVRSVGRVAPVLAFSGSVGRVAPIPAFEGSVAAVTGNMNSSKSKDRQLIRILLMDIIVYIVFSLMISLVLMYAQITQYRSKDVVQLQIDAFLVNTGTFSAYIPYCIGCYTNLLVSATFRREVKNFLMCK